MVNKKIVSRPCVATTGSFDGVHRGHQFVIEQVKCQARQRGLDAVVVTFPNHPLQVLRNGFEPQMLTLTEEKRLLLEQTAADRVVMLEFTKELAGMSAKDFMRTVLKEQLGVEVLVVGHNNHIGHDRRDLAYCRSHGEELGIEVIGCPPLTHSPNHEISSTAIRQALLQGDVAAANDMLGHPYSLGGLVVAGFQNGRKLGYPTANLQVDAQKLIPQNGAYLVKAPQGFGMLNIGTRPTLHNGTARSVEVHLFDFDDNLYGRTLHVELLHHLRHEHEFTTLDDLQRQLTADEQACRQWLSLGRFDL